MVAQLNVFGDPIEPCSTRPLTGFFRTGCCDTGPEDASMHTVCAIMTREFLEFSRARGNDLVTPAPQFGFPGLRPGDRWCLCATRWLEAERLGKAPPVVLEATNIRTLDVIDRYTLESHALKTA